MSDLNADHNLSTASERQYIPTDLGPTANEQRLAEQARTEAAAAAKEGTSVWDGIGASATQGTIGFLDRTYEQLQFRPSESWDAKAVMKEEESWKRLGIDEEQMHLLERSVSQENADYLYGIARENMQAHKDLATFSLMGQMGLGLTDPGMVALDAVAAPLGASATAGRLTNALRAGAVAAGENAAFSVAQRQFDPSVTGGEILQNAITGFAFGGALGLKTGEVAKLHDAARRYGKAVEERDAAAAAKAGQDHGGAARVKDSTVQTMDVPTRDPDAMEQRLIDEALQESGVQTAALAARRDLSARFAKSQSPFVRLIGRKLVKESVGFTDKERAVTEAASQLSKRVDTLIQSRWRPAADMAWKRYRREMGIMPTDAVARSEFFELVGRKMRDDTIEVHPEIEKLVPHVNDAFRRMANELRDAKVPGFENLVHQDGYMQRMFSRKGFEHVFQEKHLNFDDVVDQLVKPAMRRAWERNGTEFTEETLHAVAHAWLERARKKATAVETNVIHKGISQIDSASVRDVLEEAGVEPAKVEAMVKGLEQKNSDRAVHERARKRIDMDEAYWADITSRDTGETHRVGIADFLHNDVDRMLTHYTREMSGWVALSKTLGVGNRAELEKVRTRFAQELKGKDENVSDMLRVFDIATSSILGHSTESAPAGAASKWSRLLRDYSHLLTMGQAGIMMLADAGGVLGYSGVRIALKEMPGVASMFKRMADGTFSSREAQFLNDLAAGGTDFTLNPAYLRNDDIGGTRWHVPSERNTLRQRADAVTGNVLNRLDNTQQVLKRAQSVMSGMAPIQTALQRWAAKASMQRLLELAQHAEISTKWRHRLRNWGMTAEQQLALFSRLKGLKDINEVSDKFGSWEPHEREALSAYIWRVTRHQVVEGDVGDSIQMMHSAPGKILMQLRNFMTVSYTNHLLNGLHMRDWQAFTMAVTSSILGGTAYAARAYVNTIGDPKARRERLALGEIVKQGFQQSAWSSLLPMMIDTGTELTGSDPVFAYGRSSGLQTGIMGVPAIATMNRLYSAGRTAGGQLFTDKPLSRQQVQNLWNLVFLNNVTGLRNAGHALAKQFPSRSEDW